MVKCNNPYCKYSKEMCDEFYCQATLIFNLKLGWIDYEGRLQCKTFEEKEAPNYGKKEQT